MPPYITLSPREQQVIRKLNHFMYTADFIEKWGNAGGSSDPVVLAKCTGALGYYAAVKQIILAQDERKGKTK